MKGNKERSMEGKQRRDWVLCYTIVKNMHAFSSFETIFVLNIFSSKSLKISKKYSERLKRGV